MQVIKINGKPTARLSTSEFAALRGVTRQIVTYWFRHGVLPKGVTATKIGENTASLLIESTVPEDVNAVLAKKEQKN